MQKTYLLISWWVRLLTHHLNEQARLAIQSKGEESVAKGMEEQGNAFPCVPLKYFLGGSQLLPKQETQLKEPLKHI